MFNYDIARQLSMREELINRAYGLIGTKDMSHDIAHALRVLNNAERIAEIEGGDLSIIVPAALFHDAIVYPKDSDMNKYSARDSAKMAAEVLNDIEYPPEKIKRVKDAIITHSFSFGNEPKSLEAKIVYDADKLEATGAISIMRTFCSTGQMRREFYSTKDPFCDRRDPKKVKYALDLFYARLLHVDKTMFTPTGKKMAQKRTEFLYVFLGQVRDELGQLKRKA